MLILLIKNDVRKLLNWTLKPNGTNFDNNEVIDFVKYLAKVAITSICLGECVAKTMVIYKKYFCYYYGVTRSKKDPI